jgi:hypothetical protein
MRKYAAYFTILVLSIFIGCAQNSSTQEISGIWEGIVQFPGFSYRIVFLFSDGNDMQVEVIFPDQSDKTFSATSIKFTYPDILLTFDQIKCNFKGYFKNTHLNGTWEQSGRLMPLNMERVKEIMSLKRPQTPQEPFPYDEQEVSYDNGDVHIVGTLTTPKNVKAFPAVILIPGVGSHERDNTFFEHRPFFVIADFLTRNGIAVLRYDERGVGSSKDDRTQATTRDFAQDVIAGVNYLKSIPQIKEIGLIGHSEGGTIASLIAAELPDISFIVMMGSPGLNGVEYNLQFEESMSRIMEMSEKEITGKIDFQKEVLNIILEEECEDSAKIKLEKLYTISHPDLPKDLIQATLQRLLSPWFRYNLTYDPKQNLQQIICPVLALFGEKDMQVPPEGNAEAVKTALIMGGNHNFEVKEIPRVNHYFQTAQTGSPQEYRLIEETISPVVLEIIYTWIHEQIGKK